MERVRRYRFEVRDHCVMCGSPGEGHRVLGRRLDRPQGRRPGRVSGVTTTVKRCSDCGLIYSDPQPIPFDIQDHYGVVPENYWRPEYFTVPKDHLSEQIAVARRLLGDRPGMRALDIGAGIGKDMVSLERAGFEVHGLEPSAPFHQRGVERMGLDPARFKLAMVEEVEYPHDHFDLISFGVVLEHIYDPAAALERTLRWLRPGGVIRVSVPSSDWLVNRMANRYYAAIGSGLVANLSPMHTPYHLHEFSLRSFQAHGARHGHEVAFHQYFVCKTFLPGWLDRVIKPFMRWTNTGMELNVWLRKQVDQAPDGRTHP